MNRLHMVQGSGIDSDLNDTGREQAKRFFREFAGEGFQAIYTSGLKRTHQSVQKFIDLGLKWQVLPELNEISWGEKEGRAITPEDDQTYGDTIRHWKAGRTDVAFVGGETPDAVAIRLRAGLAKILAATGEERVLVCMHGRAMRVLLCLLLRYPLSQMETFEHRNLCLYKINYTGTLFALELANYNLRG